MGKKKGKVVQGFKGKKAVNTVELIEDAVKKTATMLGGDNENWTATYAQLKISMCMAVVFGKPYSFGIGGPFGPLKVTVSK